MLRVFVVEVSLVVLVGVVVIVLLVLFVLVLTLLLLLLHVVVLLIRSVVVVEIGRVFLALLLSSYVLRRVRFGSCSVVSRLVLPPRPALPCVWKLSCHIHPPLIW